MGEVEGFQGRSETWNVAQGFSVTKILKVLVLLDDYERIAEFGSLEIQDSLQLPEPLIIMNRLQAIKRLCSELLMLVGNSSFVMRKSQREELEIIREQLIRIRKVLPAIEVKRYDQRTNKYVTAINEEHFLTCLDDLKNIKERINVPLNRANLIFGESEEVDIDALKRSIIEGG